MKTNLPSNLRKALLAAFATVLATTVQLAHATDPFIGNIVFVGDSITNGSIATGNFAASGGSAPSWRYDAWKHLLDSGYTDRTLGNTTATANQNLALGAKDFQMVGSMNVYANSDAALTALATNYAGKAFYNIHQGHSGWRALGMMGGLANNNNLGSGYIRNWISDNGVNGGPRLDSTASTGWSNNSGDSNYWGKNIMNPPSTFAPNTYSPDTVVILIGVNDYTGSTGAEIYANVGLMVSMYMESNPNANFYISTILDSSRNNANIATYNALLTATPANASDWRFNMTNVATFNGNEGYALSMTYDNLHPGDQGCLIFASNVARAMGIGQRTAAQTRAATSGAGFNHTSMTASSGGWATKSQLVTGNTVNYLDIQSKAGSTGRTMSVGTGQLSAATNFTFEVSLQMYANVSNNVCSINIGNGNGLNGQLDIYGSEIRWMGTNATYTASSPATGFVLYSGINLTSGTNDFRIDWIQADVANGLLAGYYIWYNGVLIGEAMQGSATNNTAGVLNGVTIGGLSATGNTYAAIQDIALNTASSYAPLTEGATKGALVLTVSAPTPVNSVIVWPTGPDYTYAPNVSGNVRFYTGASVPTTARNVLLTGVASTNGTGDAASTMIMPTGLTTNGESYYTHFQGGISSINTGTNRTWISLSANGGLTTGSFYTKIDSYTRANGTGVVGTLFSGTMSSNNHLTGNLYLELGGANTLLVGTGGTVTATCGGVLFGGNYIGTLTGNATLVVTAGTYGTQGTRSAQAASVNCGYVFGGNSQGTVTGITTLYISGGTFYGGVFGGSYTAATATFAGGSTNLTIVGGTFDCNLYAGNYNAAIGAAGILNGTNLTIDGTNAALQIGSAAYTAQIVGGNAIAGSTIFGGTNITIQNIDASRLQYTTIDGKGAGTVNGTKTLNLASVTGTLSSAITNINTINVSDTSDVRITSALTGVNTLNVQAGSSLSTLGSSLTGLTTVTLASGANWTHGGSTVALTNSTLATMVAGSSITLNQTGRINIDCLAAGGTLAANLRGAGAIAFTTSGKTLSNWTLSGNNSDFHGEFIFTSTSTTISASNGNNPCVSILNAQAGGAADATITLNNAGISVSGLQTTGIISVANTLNSTLNITGISLLAGSGGAGKMALTNIKGNGRLEVYSLTSVGIYVVGSMTEFSGILTTQGTGANSTLHFGNDSAAITLANGNLFADGASIGNTSGTTQTTTVGNYYFRYTTDAIMNANIRAGAAITQAGTGTLTLTGSNAYTGGTTITAGKLVAGSATAFGTGAVTMSGGTLDLGNKSVANAISTTAGTGTRTITNAGAYANTLTVNANTTLTGALGIGAANLVVSGSTTLTWAGNTAVCDGVASMFTLANLTHNGIITFDLQGTTWDVGTYTLLTYTSRTGSGTYNWTSGTDVNITGALDYSTANTVKLVVSSVIPTSADINIHSTVTAANGVITKANIGITGTLDVGDLATVTLTGTSIAGAANVAGGSLTITAPSAITQVTSNITATGNAGGGNGIVDVKGEGANLGMGGAIAGGTITVTNGIMKGTLTDIHTGTKSESTLEDFTGTAAIAVAGGTGTLDNVTVGAGGMTVASDATATITGTATIAGAVTGSGTVSVEGLLHSTGSIAGVGILVQDGGTLQGSGTMGNSITVMSGGTHIVGNSPGVVSTGAYTVEEDGKAYFSFIAKLSDIGDNVAGRDYSEMTASATFSLEAGAIFRLELHNKGFLDGPPTLSDIFTYNIVLFNALSITDGETTITGIDDAEAWLQNNLSMFQLDRGLVWVGANFVDLGGVGNGAGALQVRLRYVPEPTTATLGILGLAGLLLRRRRKA